MYCVTHANGLFIGCANMQPFGTPWTPGLPHFCFFVFVFSAEPGRQLRAHVGCLWCRPVNSRRRWRAKTV